MKIQGKKFLSSCFVISVFVSFGLPPFLQFLLSTIESEAAAAASTNLGHKRASLAGEVRRVLPGIEVADARAVKVLRRRVVQQVDDDARPTFVHVRRQRHLLAALLALAAVERRFALKAVAGF